MKLEYRAYVRKDPYLNLALAICRQACDDYVMSRYLRLSSGDSENKSLMAEEKGCVQYFKGQLFTLTLDVPADVLIANLNAYVDECIKDKKRPNLSKRGKFDECVGEM